MHLTPGRPVSFLSSSSELDAKDTEKMKEVEHMSEENSLSTDNECENSLVLDDENIDTSAQEQKEEQKQQEKEEQQTMDDQKNDYHNKRTSLSQDLSDDETEYHVDRSIEILANHYIYKNDDEFAKAMVDMVEKINEYKKKQAAVRFARTIGVHYAKKKERNFVLVSEFVGHLADVEIAERCETLAQAFAERAKQLHQKTIEKK